MEKICLLCKVEPVRQKYCAKCRHNRALQRLAHKWKSDVEHRERHRVAAKLSFRKRHGLVGIEV